MSTEKKSVSFIAQKKITVITARYPPKTTPVAKISLSFQLSGRGDGFTLSLDMVMIVPAYQELGYIIQIRKRWNSVLRFHDAKHTVI